MVKLFIWKLTKDNNVSFKDAQISIGEYDLEKTTIIYSNYETPLNLMDSIINHPSTNGVYSLPIKIVDEEICIAKKLEIHDSRILISTETFMHKYINDVHVNTMDANPKYFYRGKHILPKLFIKKHLMEMRVPSRFNNSMPEHETFDEILYKEFEELKLSEIKQLLKINGITSNDKKHEAILKLINFSKMSL